MDKNVRKGARRDRNQKWATRVPDLGYYLVVTDTQETEKNYFSGLRDSIPEAIRNRLVIKVERTRIVNLVERAQELRDMDPQYRKPWIVFDRDQVVNFDKIIEKAKNAGIEVGWSNPCIEIWFYSYFGEIPMIQDSVTCCSRFSEKYEMITGQKYSKASTDIYKKLIQYGDYIKAFERSEAKIKKLEEDGKVKPSEMWPGNMVYKLVKELTDKIIH